MKDIFILGSGGFAKEVLYLINDINKKESLFLFKGFIGIESKKIKIGNHLINIFQESEFIQDYSNKEICIALGIGSPKRISKVIDRFEEHFIFPNLIHPTATGDWSNIKMDEGNIITAGCRFTTDISIKSFNIFNLNSTIGHDTCIGSYNVINPTVNISGGVTIGHINLIGTDTTILQMKSIGDNCIVGASSLVTKDIPSNVVAYGNPCKIIRKNN